MIYTCTLNPSVDYLVYLDELQAGRVNVSQSELMIPGGKGINVSRVLKRLGHSSQAFGFLGGFTGRFIEEKLNEEDIDCDFIQVPGATRINMKIRSEDETEVNGRSPEINDDSTAQLFQKMNSLSKGDVLVLSGSVPQSVRPAIYKEMLEKAVAKGVLTVVDTKDEPLREALAAKPFLIKPNHHELGDLFDVDINIISPGKAAHYARELVSMGAENVIVSMAGERAVFVNKNTTLQSTVPRGEVINSVGAGDSVVAGFIVSYLQTGDTREAFRYGIASGSASAFSEAFCTSEQVRALLSQVVIQPVRGAN